MQTSVIVDLKVKSVHPYKSHLDMVEAARELLPAIGQELGEKYGSMQITLSVAEAFPETMEAVQVGLTIVVTGILTGASEALGKELYEALKARLQHTELTILKINP